MPSQKAVKGEPQSPRDIRFVFAMAESLTNEGWGVSLISNHAELVFVTNAPASYIDLFSKRHAHILSAEV